MSRVRPREVTQLRAARSSRTSSGGNFWTARRPSGRVINRPCFSSTINAALRFDCEQEKAKGSAMGSMSQANTRRLINGECSFALVPAPRTLRVVRRVYLESVAKLVGGAGVPQDYLSGRLVTCCFVWEWREPGIDPGWLCAPTPPCRERPLHGLLFTAFASSGCGVRSRGGDLFPASGA